MILLCVLIAEFYDLHQKLKHGFECAQFTSSVMSYCFPFAHLDIFYFKQTFYSLICSLTCLYIS